MQRLCTPPKNGGKPCIGEPILTRECNKQKCPTVLKSNNNTFNHNSLNNISIDSFNINNKIAKTLFLPNLVTINLNNDKPLRYDKCHIKEDYLFVSDNAHQRTITPAKVIMNENIIAGFKGENYESNIFSFNIKETTIFIGDKDKKCFQLNNNLRKLFLCAYVSSSKNSVDEWIYEFNLFKNQCSYRKQIKQNKQLSNFIDNNENHLSNIRNVFPVQAENKPSLFSNLSF